MVDPELLFSQPDSFLMEWQRLQKPTLVVKCPTLNDRVA